MSGRGGLLERYQGDLNDTSPSPHLRYLGGDNQLAEGQWNPFSYYGYMTPPNNTFTALTGTIAAPINSFAYDNVSGILYASEEGSNILQLSDLEDVSVANYLTVSGGTIKDMVRYELNNSPCIYYILDSGIDVSAGGDGVKLGFKQLDTTEVETFFDLETPTSASPGLLVDLVDAGSENLTTTQARGLAQAINTTDITQGRTLSGVKMLLSREAGTGVGITIKVSLQGDATASTGDFTSQGAWSGSSVAYAINDTVTNGGYTWQCWNAHTSSAGDEPGVSSGWEDYWNRFGAPNGTELASGTFTLDTLSDLTATDDDYTQILFTSSYEMADATQYWIVVEESGSNMTASDNMSWMSSVNDNSTYARQAKMYDSSDNYWKDINQNGDILTSNHDNYDLRLLLTESESLSNKDALGNFSQERGEDTFLYLADNGLLYWFTGNKVHSFDGSATGGTTGTVNEAVLLFPSYTSIPDVAETRGRMYIGVQTSERSTSLDTKFFNAHRSGVFVWDRRSQVVGGSDFFPTPGAKEIRNLFTSSTGDVVAITVNNSGFCELRQLSGNQFAVIHTLEKDAYPESRRGISQVGNFSMWLGTNGTFYAYGSVASGEPIRLYKLGTSAGLTDFATPGAIYVGNKDSSNNELAVYFGWDTGAAYKISKWYPNGEGTIDSNAQKAGVGNVYTRVQQLNSLDTVQYIRGFHMPGGSDGDATVAATLKCYKNQSTTPAWSLPITYDDLAKGWFEKEWNQPNVTFLQFEVEWNATPTMGSNTYRPMYLEIETQDEGRING